MLTSTKTFIANVIQNGKPVNGVEAIYCVYCSKVAKEDFEYAENTRYNYAFCDCKLAKEEIKLKTELAMLEAKKRDVLTKYNYRVHPSRI